MRPRRLDVDTVQVKLELMSRLLDRLTRFGTVDRATLEDLDTTLILERIITQLVDLAVAVNTQIVVAEAAAAPPDYHASFLALAEVGVIDRALAARLAPSAGLRNVLIHAYVDLDLDRFVSSVPLARSEFPRYVQQVARWLLDREE